MHRFIKAAGFSNIDEAAMHGLLWEKVIQPDFLTCTLTLDEDTLICEYRYAVNKYVGICTGVLLIGDKYKEIQYYYPYFDQNIILSKSWCMLERYTFIENYAGILNQTNFGITLIFFVNNPLSFRPLFLGGEIDSNTEFKYSYLSAFANEGMVILPVEEGIQQDEDETELDFDEGSFLPGRDQDVLLDEVLGGDEEALETLNESDIMDYDNLSERIETEDLYSVVDQSFMPCGVECDQYSIIGEIIQVREDENALTGEKLWLLDISCNDISFALCMRRADLMGEPAAGRRIKCKLWMQGRVKPDLRKSGDND